MTTSTVVDGGDASDTDVDQESVCEECVGEDQDVRDSV